MKRDSRYCEYYREKPFGGRLYRSSVEPVLEPCTDYEGLLIQAALGCAHYSAGVFGADGAGYLLRFLSQGRNEERW